MRAILRLSLTTSIALAAGVPTSAPAATEKRCARFVVGSANSTAYAGMRLPARGTARGVSCGDLRRFARALHRGTPKLPAAAWGLDPEWGRARPVRYGRGTWRCRAQNRGQSGPTYAVRCTRGSRRVSWTTG